MQTSPDQNRPVPAAAGDDRKRRDAVDDALDRLSAYRFVDGPGMATHGPMGAEALSTLGHDDLVSAWVEGYKARHEVIPAPPAIARLDPESEASWRPALGDPQRLSDWDDLFTRALGESAWPDVLQVWVPRLLPGYAGAFTHGLIRTAHAVRALESIVDPSPLVTRELARGLAYWAGTFKALPGRPELRGTLSLSEAVAGLPRPDEAWSPIEAGLFSRLHELRGFPAAVEALGPPPSIDEALSDLTIAFARLVVTRPDVVPIGLVHAVTPVAGARTLLRYLPSTSTEQVYAQLWQVDAAIASGFVPASGRPRAAGDGDDAGVPVPSPDELAARAAGHRDPHAVKFTEACIRENALRPDPAYLLAAREVLKRTPPW